MLNQLIAIMASMGLFGQEEGDTSGLNKARLWLAIAKDHEMNGNYVKAEYWRERVKSLGLPQRLLDKASC